MTRKYKFRKECRSCKYGYCASVYTVCKQCAQHSPEVLCKCKEQSPEIEHFCPYYTPTKYIRKLQ